MSFDEGSSDEEGKNPEVVDCDLDSSKNLSMSLDSMPDDQNVTVLEQC